MTRAAKQKSLDQIALEIENCELCKKDRIGVSVPGEGNPDADIIFIGEAPGKNESITGRPFIGRSGKFLRKAIDEMGLLEKDVYITSPVKRLPVYVTPNDEDIKHGMTHLSKQLDVIDPKVIVLMGSVAARGVLGEKIPIAKDHGKFIKQNGKTYFISYHPSAAIRFLKVRNMFLADFKLLKRDLDKIS